MRNVADTQTFEVVTPLRSTLSDNCGWRVIRRSVMLNQRDVAPANKHGVLAAVRGIAREAWRLGLVNAEA